MLKALGFYTYTCVPVPTPTNTTNSTTNTTTNTNTTSNTTVIVEIPFANCVDPFKCYNSNYKVNTYYNSGSGYKTTYNYIYRSTSTTNSRSYNGYSSYYGSSGTGQTIQAVIVGVPIGICVLSLVVCIICIYRNTRKRKHKSASNSVELETNVHAANGPDGPYPFSPRIPGQPPQHS